MKGKKFNAAERHFKEKEIILGKYIATLKQENSDIKELNKILEQKSHDLELEVLSIKDHLERLLEYTKLSPEELRRACAKDKSNAEAEKALAFITGMFDVFK